jgi:hypothetical protein
MGAWQLGVDAARRQRGLILGDDPQNALLTIVGRVLKWVPADIVVMFGSGVALYVAANDAASWWLIPAFAGVAPALVTLTAFSGRDPTRAWWTKMVAFRTGAAPLASLLWMFTVPDTPWTHVKWVGQHDKPTIIIAAVIGALFSLIAEGLERGIDNPNAPAWPANT